MSRRARILTPPRIDWSEIERRHAGLDPEPEPEAPRLTEAQMGEYRRRLALYRTKHHGRGMALRNRRKMLDRIASATLDTQEAPTR
jgi:hypothetical protein